MRECTFGFMLALRGAEFCPTVLGAEIEPRTRWIDAWHRWRGFRFRCSPERGCCAESASRKVMP